MTIQIGKVIIEVGQPIAIGTIYHNFGIRACPRFQGHFTTVTEIGPTSFRTESGHRISLRGTVYNHPDWRVLEPDFCRRLNQEYQEASDLRDLRYSLSKRVEALLPKLDMEGLRTLDSLLSSLPNQPPS